MKYFLQQFNFTLFCSATASGISSRLLFEDKMSDEVHDLTDSELPVNLPNQVRSLLRYHVCFTNRRILNEIDVPLPGDPVFDQKKNRYNVTAYKSICAEFARDPNSDFRFTGGKNHGLGSVFIWMRGPTLTFYKYSGQFKFSDEGGNAEDRNLVNYLFNSQSKKQYEYTSSPQFLMVSLRQDNRE